MPDFTLTAISPLGGYKRSFPDANLRELPALAIVAVSIPKGEDAKVAKAIKAAYQTELPDHGGSVVSKDGEFRLIRFAADQLLVLFDSTAPDAAQLVDYALKGTGYIVDQTHNWVSLSLSGGPSRAALERICAVNLHKDVFAINRAERTVMELLGAIIIRSDEDEFMLMSARFLGCIVLTCAGNFDQIRFIKENPGALFIACWGESTYFIVQNSSYNRRNQAKYQRVFDLVIDRFPPRGENQRYLPVATAPVVGLRRLGVRDNRFSNSVTERSPVTR